MIAQKFNCAGQNCPERDGCKRYEARISHRTIKIGDKLYPEFMWASLDIERRNTGTCPNRINRGH